MYNLGSTDDAVATKVLDFLFKNKKLKLVTAKITDDNNLIEGKIYDHLANRYRIYQLYILNANGNRNLYDNGIITVGNAASRHRIVIGRDVKIYIQDNDSDMVPLWYQETIHPDAAAEIATQGGVINGDILTINNIDCKIYSYKYKDLFKLWLNHIVNLMSLYIIAIKYKRRRNKYKIRGKTYTHEVNRIRQNDTLTTLYQVFGIRGNNATRLNNAQDHQIHIVLANLVFGTIGNAYNPSIRKVRQIIQRIRDADDCKENDIVTMLKLTGRQYIKTQKNRLRYIHKITLILIYIILVLNVIAFTRIHVNPITGNYINPINGEDYTNSSETKGNTTINHNYYIMTVNETSLANGIASRLNITDPTVINGLKSIIDLETQNNINQAISLETLSSSLNATKTAIDQEISELINRIGILTEQNKELDNKVLVERKQFIGLIFVTVILMGSSTLLLVIVLVQRQTINNVIPIKDIEQASKQKAKIEDKKTSKKPKVTKKH